MSSSDQDGTANSSQVIRGATSGPRGRRLQKQQHLLGRDPSSNPSSKKSEPGAATGLDTKAETVRPSRLPTLGGRVQSIHQKASHAKSLVKGHRTIEKITSSAQHKAPPLSFDGNFDFDGTGLSRQDQGVVSQVQGVAVDSLPENTHQSQTSEPYLRHSQPRPQSDHLDWTSDQTEELLFVSFSPSPSVDIAPLSLRDKEVSTRRGLIYTAPSVASLDHGGHLAASKVQGAAQNHFPGISHEGHEYPTAKDSPSLPTLTAEIAAPTDINEFHTALEDLKAVLRTALHLASQAAEEERQERAEALARLPGLSPKALLPEQTHGTHRIKYSRVKTKKKDKSSEDDKLVPPGPSSSTSPPTRSDLHTGLQGIPLQIPPRSDSLPEIPETPIRLLDLSTSHYSRGQGILPMPPPSKTK